jgi:hypothetical protein
MARNLARALGRQIQRAAASHQKRKAESLVGERVVRDGVRLLVESVDRAADRVEVQTEAGTRSAHRLSSFLGKAVEVER